MTNPSIYSYMDYRDYLSARLREIKTKNPQFSYRAFNRLAGFKSSSTLKLVIDKKRNLSEEGAQSIQKALRLNEAESRFFKTLVGFNQAKTHEEKDGYFESLCQQKGFLAVKPLTAAQFHLFSHWYYVAVLELVRIETSEKKTLSWLKRFIQPTVELKELKKAVQDLKQLNLIFEDEKGSLQRRDAVLQSDDEVEALFVTTYHREMSDLAKAAVVEQDPAEREFSTLTIVTSPEGLKKAKQEIQKFRKRLHVLLEDQPRDGSQDAQKIVAHINLQLFRLSGPVKETTP